MRKGYHSLMSKVRCSPFKGLQLQTCVKIDQLYEYTPPTFATWYGTGAHNVMFLTLHTRHEPRR